MAVRKAKSRRAAVEEPEYYIDPLDDWIAKNHGEWAQKYSGMCVAIVEEGIGKYRVGFVEKDRGAAFRRYHEEFPGQVPFVWYVPTDEEMEMIL